MGATGGAFSGQSSSGSDDAFIAKFDGSGNQAWARQFGTGSNDWASGVTIIGTDIYVSGGTRGTLPGQTSHGGDDGYVAKFDPAGNMIWAQQFGTSSRDQVTATLGASSWIYVVGNTSGVFAGQAGLGGGDIFLAKFDASGALVWVRQIGTSDDDEAYSISADSTGLYLSGFTFGTFPGQTSSGDYDAFLLKLDASGNLLWARQFGTDTYDDASGVDTEGPGVYVAGVTWGTLPGQKPTESDDSFVAKYDSSGKLLWIRQFGTENNDYVYGIAAGRSGVLVVGQTDGAFRGEKSAGGIDAFVAKLKQTSAHSPPGWEKGKKSGWDDTTPPGHGGKAKERKITVSVG